MKMFNVPANNNAKYDRFLKLRFVLQHETAGAAATTIPALPDFHAARQRDGKLREL
ncbi:hypothetical protein [Bradyrhizobium sp. USDA 4451]